MLSAVVVAPWNEAAVEAANAIQQGLQLRLPRWRVMTVAAANRSWLGWGGTVVFVLDHQDAAGDASGLAALRTALSNRLTIVPVLLDGTVMPDEATLPVEMQHFPYLNAVLGNRTHFTALLDRVADAVQSPATVDEPWTPKRFAATVLIAAYPAVIRWSIVVAIGMLLFYTTSRLAFEAGKWSGVYTMAALGIALPISALWIGCRRLGWWGIPAAMGYLFVLLVGLMFVALLAAGILGGLLGAFGLAENSPARVTATNAVLPALFLVPLLAGWAARQTRAVHTLPSRRFGARAALIGGLAWAFLLLVDYSLRVGAASEGVSLYDINAEFGFYGEAIAIFALLELSLFIGMSLGVADAVCSVWHSGGPRTV